MVAMLASRQRERPVHVAAVIEPSEADSHPFVARLESLNVPVSVIPVRSRSYVKEYRKLSKLVARLRPRIVHTHGYRADVLGGAAARAHGAASVSTVHGFTGEGVRNRLYELVQILALRRMDAVIGVSAPIVRRLSEGGVYRERIHLIANALAATPVLARSAARERLGIGTDELVVGWVGRLSKEKGADVMLEALAAADPRWRLSVIGNGSELAGLREQAATLRIAERVAWHGALADAGFLLTAFDAFVLSSRTEGTPITILEAMNARVPIVATRVGGIPDMITPAHALLVDPEAPSEIATALEEVRGNADAANRRTELAHQRLLECYDLSVWADAIERVYEGIATFAD